MAEESSNESSGEAVETEAESSRISGRDVAAKGGLRVVFLVGVVALMLCTAQPYPLLSGQMTTLGLLAVCACAGFVVLRAPRDAPVVPKDVLMVLLPWFLAAALFANGAFDSSPEALHRTVVVRTSYGRRSRALVVQSWRPGNSTELLSLAGGFFGRYGFFYPGQTVTVGTRSGALGMPWVTRISR